MPQEAGNIHCVSIKEKKNTQKKKTCRYALARTSQTRRERGKRGGGIERGMDGFIYHEL